MSTHHLISPLCFVVSSLVLISLAAVSTISSAADDERPKQLLIRCDDVGMSHTVNMAVRELIHNTFKHAGAKRVKLSLCAGKKRITITVQDDGKGFDQSTLDDLSYGEGGFGLFHIKMRLDQYGGVLSVKSKIGGGTSITISIPVTHEPERIDLL